VPLNVGGTLDRGKMEGGVNREIVMIRSKTAFQISISDAFRMTSCDSVR
jgi:hypothetical protein